MKNSISDLTDQFLLKKKMIASKNEEIAHDIEQEDQ